MEVTNCNNCIHCRICKNKEIFLNVVSEINETISNINPGESIIFSVRCKDFSESKPTPKITGHMGVIP